MSGGPTPVSFPALGTTATLLTDPPDRAAIALDLVQDMIETFDQACSRFRPDSELCLLNQAAGRPVRVSSTLLAAVQTALRAAELTDGKVDPTVGTAMHLLGYDRDFAAVEPAGAPLRVQVATVPGWWQVRVDARRATVHLPPGVELDLGATAKALCADRAAQRAAEASGASILVSLGGDVALAGPIRPGGWDIRVTDHHAQASTAPGQTVAISSGGLATSGTTARRWQRGQETLHHVLDPATGRPAAEHWRTVSVAAGSCVDANTASCAAIVLGPAAPPWLAARHLPARLVDATGRVIAVAGWPDPSTQAARA